jgi:dCMP deaminase
MLLTDKWDRKYLELAKYIASEWSKDPPTKVGAVVVNYEHQKEFFGYNGFPAGVEDTPERYNNRDLKYKLIVHAEANALYKAGTLAKGASLYVYPSFGLPAICNECAKAAIQCGIKEVVSYIPDVSDSLKLRWEESISLSALMLKEAGVTWRGLQAPNPSSSRK